MVQAQAASGPTSARRTNAWFYLFMLSGSACGALSLYVLFGAAMTEFAAGRPADYGAFLMWGGIAVAVLFASTVLFGVLALRASLKKPAAYPGLWINALLLGASFSIVLSWQYFQIGEFQFVDVVIAGIGAAVLTALIGMLLTALEWLRPRGR